VGRADEGLISCTTRNGLWKWTDRRNIVRSKCKPNRNLPNLEIARSSSEASRTAKVAQPKARTSYSTADVGLGEAQFGAIPKEAQPSQTSRRRLTKKTRPEVSASQEGSAICFTDFTEFVTAPQHCAKIVPDRS